MPLAYLLQDEALIRKAQPWIEWVLTHQEASGYLGPKRFAQEPRGEPGIQKTPREDWWPRMVMLKVLQQYYSAAGDPRVVEVLLRYFRYQLQELPKTPLDHWSFWANRRGGDNLMVVYWLYNLTGEPFLLELAELLHEQTYPWTEIFLNRNPAPSTDLRHLYPYNIPNRYPFDRELIRRLSVEQWQSFHCVNFAQGIKAPLVYWQHHPGPRYPEAVTRALAEVKKYHGQPQGMFGGDEPMHGNHPTQGVELCAITEMMFSLEVMLPIRGDLAMADLLERIAFNALPAQTTEDFRNRQYFQSANQVMATRARRNFFEDDAHGGTDLCFGVLNGYPCCTCNMHQGWPKLVQNLWYAAPDGGLAALVYAPCTLSTQVADGTRVRIVEETDYPFEESIRFTLEPEQPVEFSLHFRVPDWARGVGLRINDQEVGAVPTERLLRVRREWKAGDRVTLDFETEVRLTRWMENAVAVERGPLVYALRIQENWQRVNNQDHHGEYYEVRPGSPWNYALLHQVVQRPEDGFRLVRKPIAGGAYPWGRTNAPLVLHTRGKRVPEWRLYNEMSGPLPHAMPAGHLRNEPSEEIVVLPYGCTRLRITEFPVAH